MSGPAAPTFDRYTVADFTRLAWRLHLECACGRVVVWPSAHLRSYPAHLAIAAIGRQAQCSACGEVGVRWWPSQDHGASEGGNPVAPIIKGR